MNTQVVLPTQVFDELTQFVTENRLYKKAFLCGYAISWCINYFRAHGSLPPQNISEAQISPNTCLELSRQASDLPGMSRQVIMSHMVRFPDVTPEKYKSIIEELKRRQASPEGLKNPEAAAYGLCKRIQSGHADGIEAKKQEPSAPSETAENSVPDDAFAYPPQF